MVQTALEGQPDITHAPVVQARVDELGHEAQVLVEAIRRLGAGQVADPLSDPGTLAQAVEIGLLDAPQLKRNRFARGEIRTRAIEGAIVAVDEDGLPLSEEVRIQRLLAKHTR